MNFTRSKSLFFWLSKQIMSMWTPRSETWSTLPITMSPGSMNFLQQRTKSVGCSPARRQDSRGYCEQVLLAVSGRNVHEGLDRRHLGLEILWPNVFKTRANFCDNEKNRIGKSKRETTIRSSLAACWFKWSRVDQIQLLLLSLRNSII